ncbi:MAG TPA: ribonuclease HII [Cytophagaceae bacterium]|jgi:ribonuclease HII|nr:ribonuclease HII [Cytophagaceae bacterium]
MLQPYYLKDKVEAGLDEAGRGCLAGPVVAAAVILPTLFDLPGLNDSKKLNAAKREELAVAIKNQAIAYAIAFVSNEEIDEINILNASFLAMHRALDQLKKEPQHLLVDGNRFKAYQKIPHACIIQGDGKYASIAAASILAKTRRDEYMLDLHQQFPHYAWNTNMGYPTTAHRDALREHGFTPHHRLTFQCLPAQLDIF